MAPAPLRVLVSLPAPHVTHEVEELLSASKRHGARAMQRVAANAISIRWKVGAPVGTHGDGDNPLVGDADVGGVLGEAPIAVDDVFHGKIAVMCPTAHSAHGLRESRSSS